MKISVSLAEDDIEFLDAHALEPGVGSRSAAIQQAVRLLRAAQLGSAYEDAWAEWSASGDEGVWVRTAGDGLKR